MVIDETNLENNSKKINILSLQMEPVLGDKEANFNKISALMEQNKDFKADLITLPEVFNIGVCEQYFHSMAEDMETGESVIFMSEIAKKYNTNVVAGSLVEKRDENYYNTQLILDRDGKTVSKYSKIHLFSHKGGVESKYITSGDRLAIADLDIGKVGHSVCYDIRFPELYRNLTLAGAEILVCTAAWPVQRLKHWVVLNKARAIENLSFMISTNQTGRVGKSRLNAGNSMVISPWGDIISSAGIGECAVRATIDLNDLKEIRKGFSVFCDIKPEAYRV